MKKGRETRPGGPSNRSRPYRSWFALRNGPLLRGSEVDAGRILEADSPPALATAAPARSGSKAARDGTLKLRVGDHSPCLAEAFLDHASERFSRADGTSDTHGAFSSSPS
jgi:hypothetical protein